MGTNANQLSPQQVNGIARSMIAAQSVRMIQQIYGTTVVPANQNVINVIPRNVGLIMGFWVKVVSTIHNATGGGTGIVATDFGAANLLSQVQFTDLNNNVRIQTSGWHLNYVNTVKGRMPYGSALLTTAIDGNAGIAGEYGSNWTVNSQPNIADGADGTVIQWYYVPLAYSDGDYRGAVYANVVNATMQLQLTINTTPVVAAANDTTEAVYTAAGGAGSNTSTTITVYQDYLDQLPFGKSGPILPILDLSTVYELKRTIFTALVPNQDFPMQYANFRDFVSTFAVFFNGTARAAGADVNTWALQSANFTNLWKLEPNLVALRSRALTLTDFPKGVYYFGSRHKPIATTQYGNMELVLNANVAGAGAYVKVGYEDFALVNTITQAGSLPSN
jgi:P3 major capsid protein